MSFLSLALIRTDILISAVRNLRNMEKLLKRFFWYFAFLITLAAVTVAECIDKESCYICVNTLSWNPFAHCRWCPLDRKCHTFGAVLTNPCPEDVNIKYDSSCPATHDVYGSYDKDLAYEQTLLSAVSYSDEPFKCADNIKSRENNLALDFEVVSLISMKCGDSLFDYRECAVVIALSLSSQSIYISFRGTTSLEQLVKDKLSVLFEPTSDFGRDGGHVQEYFLDYFEKLKPCLTTQIVELKQQYPDYMVRFSGHSLGGALASIAAFFYVYTNKLSKDEVSLYTFGMPRVGDKVFAVEHDSALQSSFRVVNHKDCVPHYPEDLFTSGPERETSPYHHRTEVFYDTTNMEYNSNYNVCYSDEDESCSHKYQGLYETCPLYNSRYFDIPVGTHCDDLSDRKRDRTGTSDIDHLLSNDKCSILKETDIKLTITTATTTAATTTAVSDDKTANFMTTKNADKVSAATLAAQDTQILTCITIYMLLL